MPLAEVFSDLATEITQEVVFLETVEELNPDVRRLSNVRNENSKFPK